MADDSQNKWHLPTKQNFSRRNIVKHVQKVEVATLRHTRKFITKRLGNIREVQKDIIIWVLIMGVLIAAAGLQLMWYQNSYSATAPANDGTYAEAVLGPVSTLNPIFASSSAEKSASYLLFSSLLKYDTTGHLNYDLATDVQANDTKTVYRVSLRSDAKWQDGVSLTADDVAFTVGLIKNPSVRSTISGWDNVTVKVINNTTVEFTLPSVYAAFEHVLTFPILPKHILGKIAPSNIRENSFSNNPIGSGSFKLRFTQTVSSDSDKEIIYLARNDNYYGGTAKLSRLQLNVYSTTDEILTALDRNEVNAAADLSPFDTVHVDSRRYAIRSQSIQSGVYALLNTKSQLLSNVVLRRALQLATDTQAVRDKLPIKTASLDLPFTDNQLVGDVPKVTPANITAAKKLLDDNGWRVNSQNIRENNGQQLKLSVITIKNSQLESALKTLTEQWRAIGIVVETQVVDLSNSSQNVAQNILQARNFDVLIYQLDIGADPDVYAYWHSSQAVAQGLNFSNYSNAISDDALASARVRTEATLRNAKYITFAKQWIADVPAIGLYQSTAQYVYRSNIIAGNSSNVLVLAIDRYSDVLDWSVGNKEVYKTP